MNRTIRSLRTAVPASERRRWQVSTGGGTCPAWVRTGRELFYLNDEGLLTAVPVRTSGPAFSAGTPVRVLDQKNMPRRKTVAHTTFRPDGRRFLMIKDTGSDLNVTPAE